jgi:hypothetical protein
MAIANNQFASPTIGRTRPNDSNIVGSVPATAATGLVTGLSVAEYGQLDVVRKTVFTFTNYPLAYVRTSASISANSGSNNPGRVYTFPEGVIQVVGAVANLVATTPFATSAGFIMSVGTVQAAADATLTSTEANIIASTATAVASSTGTFVGTPISTYISPLNGSSTAINLYVNAATADDTTSSGNITLNGTVTITWIPLGDNT